MLFIQAGKKKSITAPLMLSDIDIFMLSVDFTDYDVQCWCDRVVHTDRSKTHTIRGACGEEAKIWGGINDTNLLIQHTHP